MARARICRNVTEPDFNALKKSERGHIYAHKILKYASKCALNFLNIKLKPKTI